MYDVFRFRPVMCEPNLGSQANDTTLSTHASNLNIGFIPSFQIAHTSLVIDSNTQCGCSLLSEASASTIYFVLENKAVVWKINYLYAQCHAVVDNALDA